MSQPTPEPDSFSVIVASHSRPDWLQRCLQSLRQQDHPCFEIVVVADGDSLAALDSQNIRCVEFGEKNLAAARNLGVRNAGGRFCAFIDDDAVAEPMWLRHLQTGFQLPDVAAVVGSVRGRNGISFQSLVLSIDAEGETHVEAVENHDPFVPDLTTGRALKLVGTNFAVRRGVLQDHGGFDESFRFYLEDSDLSFRMMRAGRVAAAAPLAEVHHGFAPSVRRSNFRAPLDLTDIGRSSAIYLRKHLADFDADAATYWDRIRKRESSRLFRHMVAGSLEPRDIRCRLKQLETGWADGKQAELSITKNESKKTEFTPFPTKDPGHTVLASKWLSRRKSLLRSANEIVTSGGRASVFSFSLTPVRHHVRYVGNGVWLQTGGVYGRSDRDGRFLKWCRFAQRLRTEIGRVAKSRGIGETTFGKWWDQSRSNAQG